jgi:hypothetical protein
MIHLGWALKNACATFLVSLPVGLMTGALPANFSPDALFWGAIGGICRPLANFLTEKETEPNAAWKAGGHTLLGGLCALSLNGVPLPFEGLRDLAEKAPNIQPFIVGLTGIIVIGGILDLANAYRKARSGVE